MEFLKGFLLLPLCLLSFESTASDSNFHVVVIGGEGAPRQVSLYNLVDEDPVCKLGELQHESRSSPFGSLLDGNVTICGGDSGSGQHCYTWKEEQWKRAMRVEKLLFSSAINTYDNSVWTFFGGEFAFATSVKCVWNEGEDEFTKSNLGFELGLGSCSTRLNQSHVIVSKGSKNVYWYTEETEEFVKWEAEGAEVVFATCGFTHDHQLGPQFVVGGGELESEKRPTSEVAVYNVLQDLWTAGDRFPENQMGAVSVQFQNTFLSIGGSGGVKVYDHVLKYDSSEGWLQLPMRLETPNYWMGALHVVHPATLKCSDGRSQRKFRIHT